MMSKKIIRISLLIFLPLTFSSSFAATVASIQNIGTLPGGVSSIANGVSGNGNVVVGISYSNIPAIDGHAFKWTQIGSMTTLPSIPGSTVGSALGVNADGSVIVGKANSGGLIPQAVIWAAGGIQNISPDTSFNSSANGVNANGSVVVGEGFFNVPGVGVVNHAFRWTSATGITEDIGIGPATSRAFGVDASGGVVVGEMIDINTAQPHAFRWTQASGMVDIGFLPSQINASARATNLDGSVVVGTSGFRAFRWTQAGMEDLGVAPGLLISSAMAVNADGSVIVGSCTDALANSFAARWTRATGFQTVENWLADAGVDISTIPPTRAANGVSYDGSVVVGELQNGQAFVARVITSNPLNPTNAGLATISDLYNSLSSTSTALTLASNSTGLVLHGSHGHPLDNRIYEGCNGFWVNGDWGYFRNKTPNDQRGPTALAELGFAHLFNDYIQAGIGAGRTSSTQHLISNSRIVVNGTYFIAESITKLPCDVWATLTGYYLFGKEKIQRGYILSAANNSAGNPSVTTPAARARLDWENAACFNRLALSPYADFSYVSARLDAYTEHLGSFPSSFNKRRDHSTEARVGINSSLNLGCFNLLGTVEGVHHFERRGIAANGQVLGLFAFNLPGQRIPQNWLRGSLGFKQPFLHGVFTVYLNGSTRGLDPRIWAAASYNLSF